MSQFAELPLSYDSDITHRPFDDEEAAMLKPLCDLTREELASLTMQEIHLGFPSSPQEWRTWTREDFERVLCEVEDRQHEARRNAIILTLMQDMVYPPP